MPTLLIARLNGTWSASPANSGVSYTFQAVGGDQSVAVQQLAVAMQDGTGAVIAGANEIFVIPNGVTSQQVVESLFRTTDVLTYIERIIYGTIGDEMLIDDMSQAGIALAAALAA